MQVLLELRAHDELGPIVQGINTYVAHGTAGHSRWLLLPAAGLSLDEHLISGKRQNMDDLLKSFGRVQVGAEVLFPALLHAIETLAVVHEQGWIHRDLKPQHFYARSTETADDGISVERVIIDWSNAANMATLAADLEADTCRAAVGTPGFTAPEVRKHAHRLPPSAVGRADLAAAARHLPPAAAAAAVCRQLAGKGPSAAACAGRAAGVAEAGVAAGARRGQRLQRQPGQIRRKGGRGAGPQGLLQRQP